VKLVLAEPGSKEAGIKVRSLLRGGFSPYTVDLALAEGLNALWKHVRLHGDLEAGDARSAVKDLALIYDGLKVLTARELSEEAMDIALNREITAYDSLYIAAARRLKATLYTADRKLYQASKGVAVAELLKPSARGGQGPMERDVGRR